MADQQTGADTQNSQNVNETPVKNLIFELFADHPDPDVRMRVAEKEDCPENILVELAEDEEFYIAEEVGVTIQNWQTLDRLAKTYENLWLLVGIGRNRHTAAQTLAWMCDNYRDLEIRVTIAQNPNCAEKTLQKLLAENYTFLTNAVAQNPAVSNKVLTQIVESDPEDSILNEILFNKNTSGKLLKTIYENKKSSWDTHKFRNLYSNPNLKTSMFEHFLKRGDEHALQYLARNPKLTGQQLTAIYKKAYKKWLLDTISEVAAHENCPQELLEEIVESFQVDRWDGVIANVATNPSLNAETLTQLADHPESEIREIVATNVNTTQNTLYKLAEDEDDDVRIAVAQNPNCPEELLQKIAYDKHASVQDYVVLVKSVSVKLSRLRVEYLAENNISESTKLDVLLRLGQTTQELVKNPDAEKLQEHIQALLYTHPGNDRRIKKALEGLYVVCVGLVAQHNFVGEMTTFQKLTMVKQAQMLQWKTPYSTQTPGLRLAPAKKHVKNTSINIIGR